MSWFIRCSWCGGSFNGGNCQRCTNVSFGDEFVRNPDPISYDETPDFSYPPPQSQTYSCELYGNDSHYGYDCPPQEKLHKALQAVCKKLNQQEQAANEAIWMRSMFFLEIDDSFPEYETFCFNIKEKSSGSTTTHSDYSLPDYDAFYFDDDHIEEKSNGSTTTHSDFSLPEYDSFIFDLLINPFPHADRSVSHHEEFANKLADIISPPVYDRFYFDLEIVLGEFTRVLEENIFDLSTKGLLINELNDSSLLLSDCDSSLSKEFSEIDLLVSFPSGNEDMIFDPGLFNIHDLRSVETEFVAIAFNDGVSSEKTLSCEPTVSSLNDEIDFKILFDDSDDEDYTVVFDKNSFFYKIISTNDLKTDLENDNEKVNMPSIPLPEPTVSCFDDLDFFKDFKNEFPAIVYNDAQTSKSDLLIEPILNPQHIDEFDLNDETSLSEYDEEEQNVFYGGQDMDLSPRDQRHQYLRYKGLQYIDVDIVDFEMRLAKIYRREVHRVQVFDFGGLPDLMAEGLRARMLMEHRDAQRVSLFASWAWRRLSDIKGLLVHELILEFFNTFRFGETILDLDTARALQFQLGGIPDKGDLRDYWIGISSVGYFLGTAPSYTSIRDLILRLCHGLIVCSIAGRSQAPEKYLRLFAAGRKSGGLIFGGQFIARLAEQFGLLKEERLQGLTVIAPTLLVIDMAELAPQQPPPPPSHDVGRTMPQRLGRLEEELMKASGQTYQAFDGTFRGSSPAAFQRRTRQRTDGASTSAA
ncbi:hypothetical protein Tco_1185691 [Tanacetum coccineum]